MFKRVDKSLLGSIFKHSFGLRGIVLHSNHKASGGYMFFGDSSLFFEFLVGAYSPS
jgi:hypothetical protein